MLLYPLLMSVTLIRLVTTNLIGESFYNATLTKYLSLEDTGSSNLLLPFNRTRIPGSIDSREVQKFIISHFEHLKGDWTIETDSFIENDYTFTNLVFTFGRNASSYLVLAAHYDSKILPDGFIGGTDSAAPCAILMYISSFIDSFATDPLLSDGFSGIKIVFFDGEEAIEQWSQEDSIYGARHLAASWEDDGIVNDIELFILMDLLGSKESRTIPSYHSSSHIFYQTLSKIERIFSIEFGDTDDPLFDVSDYRFLSAGRNLIEDDHTPFLSRGVPVLHLIPFPFPSTWHTLEDDFEHLSEKEIHKWAILMCEFILYYHSNVL